MAAKSSELNLIVKGDSSSGVAALDLVGARLAALKKETGDTLKAAGWKGPEKPVIDKLGGVEGAADKFAAASKDAERFFTTLRTGGDAFKALDEQLQRIPIAGKFLEAGEALREVIRGTKAALVEAEKWSASAERVADGYRQIAAAQSLMGLRGAARETRETDIGADERIKALHAQKEALQKQADEINGRDGFTRRATSFLSGGKEGQSQAELDELKRIVNEKKLVGAQVLEASKERALKEREIEGQTQRDLFLFHRDTAQKIEALEAHMEEVALRRSGKPLESAMMKVQQSFIEAKHDIENQAEAMARPFEKSAKALTEKGNTQAAAKQAAEAAKIHQDANAQIVTLDRQRAQTIEELEFEEGRKRSEQAKALAEDAKQSTAEANVERLRATGQTLAAERAQVREHYRKKIEELEKQSRQERHTLEADASDPGLKAAKAAALDKAHAELANVDSKDKKEHAAKQLEAEQQMSHLRMDLLREEAAHGDAKAQREAKLAEIQEKTKERLLEIAKLQQNENLTLAQRLGLMGLMTRALADEAKAKKRMETGGYTPASTFSLEDAGSRSVFGDGPIKDAPQPPVKIQNSDDVATAIINKLVSSAAQLASAFGLGGGYGGTGTPND